MWQWPKQLKFGLVVANIPKYSHKQPGPCGLQSQALDDILNTQVSHVNLQWGLMKIMYVERLLRGWERA